MPVDFDKLVLASCMNTFAKPITVLPRKSQPGKPAYAKQRDGVSPLRGIWEVTNVDIPLEDGTILSSDTIKLGIRYAEFAVPPVAGDRITVEGDANTYEIDDPDDDGQGGSKLTLKKVRP